MAMRLWLGILTLIGAQILATLCRAEEVCRFLGTTDFRGKLEVVARDGTSADGVTTIDVTGRFTGTPMLFVHVTYLMQEISTWKSGQLQSVAVNTRHIVDGRIVHQLWDVFERSAHGFEAYRLQGSPEEFRRKRPGFVPYWDPSAFGRPWLQDYWAAHPDRRRDLDLPELPPGSVIRPPLALAFYWSRKLPEAGQQAIVILPGFKRDKSVPLIITPRNAPAPGTRAWQTAVRYPALDMTHPSIATAVVSEDGHLLQLSGRVIMRTRIADGIVRQQGCRWEESSSQTTLR
jgi:hypothetical protein